MSVLAGLLLTWWPYLAGALAAIAGVLGIYVKGRRNAQQQRTVQDYRRMEEIREAERLAPRSQHDRFKRLRDGSA